MRWLLAAVVLLALFEPAFAAKPVSCLDVEAEAEARIAACTSALEANKTAEAYVDRATAYDSYARWHEALADLDKALALNPKHMVALKLRAIAHEIMAIALAPSKTSTAQLRSTQARNFMSCAPACWRRTTTNVTTSRVSSATLRSKRC